MRARFKAATATALAATAVAAAWAVPAEATPTFELRVETPGATLDPGTHYAVPDQPLADRGRLTSNNTGTCVRAPGRHELHGPTALGLVAAAAQANPALRPLLVAEDSFGRRVCGIGAAVERDTPSFSGWLFKHDHLAPPMSAELVPLHDGSEVVWLFADFDSGANTGDELVMSAPVRTQPGLIQVFVQSVTFEGLSKAAPDGTLVLGGSAVATTTGGVATVSVAEGEAELRAYGTGASSSAIPSAPQSVCVAADLAQCPEERGRRIVGTNGKDRLAGTDGPDHIRARGGKDKVRIKGGGEDFVNCGKGKDVVIADKEDRFKRCDRVRGPAGKGKKKKGGRNPGGRKKR